MLIFAQVVGGLLLLFFGGELLVRAAVALARKLGVSPLIIGMSVVAAGTSAPELVVSLVAAFEDAPGIAVGNVVGSNIANLLLVIGAAGLIYPLKRHKQSIYRDGSVLIGATIVFVLLCAHGQIDRWHGVVMLLLLVAYLVGSYVVDRRDQKAAAEIAAEVAELASDSEALWLTLTKLALGVAGVTFGSEILVNGAVTVARHAGLSDTTIGITLVAVGTSLPELAASIIAARNRHTDVALGNAVGSCTFNLLAIMGTVAVVHPIPVPEQILQFDLWVMLGVTLGFIALALAVAQIGRLLAAIFLCLYIAYTVSQFVGVSALGALAN